MFKTLVIQRLNTLSDERTEYLINDRLSFMRFLELRLSDRVLDTKMVCLFRECLTQAGAIESLFNRFDMTLRNTRGGSKQRNTSEEKAALREGRLPTVGKEKPAKLAPKDQQARWTQKFTKAKRQDGGSLSATDLAIPFVGYTSHISIDWKFRLIWKWKTTHAAASDGVRLCEGFLDKSTTASSVWVDTAYRSKTTSQTHAKTYPEI